MGNVQNSESYQSVGWLVSQSVSRLATYLTGSYMFNTCYVYPGGTKLAHKTLDIMKLL